MDEILQNDKKFQFYLALQMVEDFYLSKYPSIEIQSFTTKNEEAKNYLQSQDPSSCPTLYNELTILYGRQPSSEELQNFCNFIIQKASVFLSVVAKVSAIRKKFELDPDNFDLNEIYSLFPEVFS